MGRDGLRERETAGTGGPPWEREVPCLWRRWVPVGGSGALPLARLDPHTYACMSTLGAGAGAGPRSPR